MVTYEITAKVGKHLAGEYEQYMRERHIPDLLETGAFHHAQFSVCGDELYQVRYEAKSREDLDIYLNLHAARFRTDFLRRFPEGVELSRREWDIVQTW